ncbi:hypothetical protein [Cedecea lapagei]|uniref:hypothetical protein n=1 Tax=Cedecea lapagei TaxID=158823 RepID=UPI002022CE8D|nr:hypothetical protein [Cedecea lapagei]
MIYDSVIEPSGTKIDMLFHSYSNYFNAMNNPNLSKEARKSMKVSDYDFLDILSDPMTTKERAKKRQENKKAEDAKNMKAFGEKIKSIARSNNGKK